MSGDSTFVPRGHVVQFYSRDDELTAGVAIYLMDGLSGGGAAIAVADAAHLAAFEASAPEFGVDLDAARREGRYFAFDAYETYERFMVDLSASGCQAFVDEFAELISRCVERGHDVRAYGEMVSLLWQGGHVARAMDLERAWSEIQLSLPFALYCAYPSSIVDGEHGAHSAHEIACHHSAVIRVPPSLARHNPADALDGVERARSFPCDLLAVGDSRLFVADTLRDWKLDAVIPDAVLLVSELATNAVEHAGSDFTVALAWEGSTLCVSVVDSSSTRPFPVEAEPAEHSSRGLRVISALARRWGSDAVADGKLLWVELDV